MSSVACDFCSIEVSVCLILFGCVCVRVHAANGESIPMQLVHLPVSLENSKLLVARESFLPSLAWLLYLAERCVWASVDASFERVFCSVTSLLHKRWSFHGLLASLYYEPRLFRPLSCLPRSDLWVPAIIDKAITSGIIISA